MADAILKSMVDIMIKTDPNYLERYNRILRKRCKDYAADPNCFAFNESTLAEFQKIDEEMAKLAAAEVKSAAPEEELNKMASESEKENDSSSEILSIDELDRLISEALEAHSDDVKTKKR